MLTRQINTGTNFSFFEKNFNSRKATYVCFVLALLNKIIIVRHFFSLSDDKSLFLLLSKSLLSGHGLKEPLRTLNDTVVYNYNSAVASPLYSILAAPFLWLTNSYSITAFSLDIFSWLIFFSALWAVSKECFKERWIVNLFLLGVGFFIYPHQLDSTPKDTLAIGLVLWSAYLSYRYVSATFSLARTILLGLCLISLGLIKFLYVPPVAIFLLSILASSWKQDRKKLIGSLLVSFVCMGLAVLTKHLINIALEKGPNLPLVSDGTVFTNGFFPENLFAFFPFISSSIVNTGFLAVQAEQHLPLSFTSTMQVFQIVDVVAAIVTMVTITLFWRKIKLPQLLRFLLAISLVVVCIVFYMSLRHEAFSYKGSTSAFTYVREARSFLLPMLSIQLLLFFWLFKMPGSRLIRLVLFFVFALECLHGVYFTLKHLGQKETSQLSAKETTTNKLSRLQNQLNANIATTDNALRRYMEMKHLKVYAATYNCIEYKSSKSLVIAATLTDALVIEKCFDRYELTVIDSTPQYRFYRYR